MVAFKVDVCFGVDISFDYFDVDLLLDALQIGVEVRRSKRVLSLIQEHGKHHRIILIAKRQMALDLVKDALDKGVLPYINNFEEKVILSSEKDRLYDAEERFLQICLSLSVGKSVKGLKKLNGSLTSDLRALSNSGRSLFRYFRSVLNDHTRDYIVAFKGGRLEEPLLDQVDLGEISASERVLASVKKKSPSQTVKNKATSFSVEIAVANKLFSEGKKLVSEQVQFMKTGAPLDVVALQKFCQLLTASYERNPFALLALRHVKTPASYLSEHLLSSAVLGIHFSRVIGLSDAYVSAIALGGILFDIGRFRLPDALASKSEKLTANEFDLFRKHIDFALSAVKQSDGLVKLIYQMIDDHHERVDGTGYPRGKQDGEISIYGKIAAIIDAYDAMTSEQQHKASMGPVKACERLLKESGLAFDKALVKAFVQSMGQYPVGSCVLLSNNRIGFIITLNKQNQPALVRQVFSLSQNAFIPVTDISVDQSSSKQVDVYIVEEADPQIHKIQFINHLL